MKRLRIRGRGVIRWPGDPLDGTKCFILQKLPDGRLLIRTRTLGADTLGTLMRIAPERLELEPA